MSREPTTPPEDLVSKDPPAQDPPPASPLPVEPPRPSLPPEEDERPPLGSWRRMYALVLGNLALLILLFYWFTKAFE